MRGEGYWKRFIETLHRLHEEKIKKNVSCLFAERELFRMIAESLKIGIAVTDAKGGVVYVNPAALRITGGEGREGDVFPLWETLKKEEREEGEVKIDGATPRYLWFWKTAWAENILFSFLDITEQKQREEDRIWKDKFSSFQYLAAGVAHELGNPLNALKIHADLMERMMNKGEEEKAREHLRVIKEEILRLESIVQDFLDVLRPIHLSLSEMRVEEVIKSTLELFLPAMQEKGVICEIKLSESTPPLLLDRERLKQALINILNNALHATGRNGKIVVSTGEQKGFVHIVITDDGEGIPASALAHIFEPFFTTREKGMGLGLTITQRIVKAHGGSIEVKSKPGKGTITTISLPIKRTQVPLPAKRQV
ncbi:MAG: PAS domain-containing protein [Caldiserica bacterium]|nr:PAS domain-containing protein [Caldisericota bacterium]